MFIYLFTFSGSPGRITEQYSLSNTNSSEEVEGEDLKKKVTHKLYLQRDTFTHLLEIYARNQTDT